MTAHREQRPAVLESVLGQPLASSNLASSATLTCKNTPGRSLETVSAFSFVSVLGHKNAAWTRAAGARRIIVRRSVHSSTCGAPLPRQRAPARSQASHRAERWPA